MKTTITLFAAMVLMVGSAMANDGDKKKKAEKESAKITVVKWNDEVHQLFYEGEANKVQVKVMDEKGSTLWRSRISNENGFALPLNFKLQDAGNYKVEVKDGNGSYQQEFTVED